jgi:serine/threonine protein phosphatase PrpC
MRRSARGVSIEFAELSDSGLDPAKKVNEDACLYAETAHGHLAVVCDGMGGHQGGREASQTAVAKIAEGVRGAPAGAVPAEVLGASIRTAGQVVHELGRQIPIEARPGTTCVAVLIYDGKAEIAHVGDSRLYLVRDGELHQLTRDHSMVQQMLDAGALSEAQALAHPDANRITRALGMFPTVNVEMRPAPLALAAGDVLLLCSDGLTDMLDERDLLSAVRETIDGGPELCCQRLVDAANEKGGADNITVQVLIVSEVSTLAEPTVVDSPGPGEPPPTEGMTQAATPTPAMGHGPAATQPEHRPRPAPTLVDAPEPGGAGGRARRVTEPWVSPSPELDGEAHQPTLPDFPVDRVAQRPKGRSLVLGAAFVTVCIVLGIVLWWLLGTHSSAVDSLPH